MPLSMDLSSKGFEMFFKPWQVTSIKYLLSIRPEGANSRKVWEYVNSKTKISRASIINYLNNMVDEDILSYTEETGKGGHHRVYVIKFDEGGLKEYLAKEMITKLLDEYSDETDKTIKNVNM